MEDFKYEQREIRISFFLFYDSQFLFQLLLNCYGEKLEKFEKSQYSFTITIGIILKLTWKLSFEFFNLGKIDSLPRPPPPPQFDLGPNLGSIRFNRTDHFETDSRRVFRHGRNEKGNFGNTIEGGRDTGNTGWTSNGSQRILYQVAVWQRCESTYDILSEYIW